MSKGQKVGYVRVSTWEQNTARQLDGLELDRVFEDKLSGKDTNRPALTELLKFVRDGDTLYVQSMDRLARNLADLLELVKQLNKRGVRVEFVTEGLSFTGEDSPMNMMMLGVLGAAAEFFRRHQLQAQREGIAKARAEGKYKNTGRKPILNAAQVKELRERAASGEKKTKLAKDFGIGRTALYYYLKESA